MTDFHNKSLQLKDSYIILQDVRFYAFHGVMPQERSVGTDFLVNVRIGYDISKAMQSDNVEDTISYAEVYNLIKKEMETPSKLLENLASRVANAITSTFPEVYEIYLSIIKVNPPMGADCKGAGVEIHLSDRRKSTFNK